jgi:hypothetical protein
MSNPVGKPKRTHSVCCEAELIITPAYPVRDRVVRCSACGRRNENDYVKSSNTYKMLETLVLSGNMFQGDEEV